MGTDAAPLDRNKNDGQATSHDIADLKAEIIECTAGDHGVIAGGDDKSANKDNKTDNTTAGPPSLQTITTTNALVAPPSVTPEAGAQVATQLRPLDPDLLKAVVGKQSDLGKQGDAGHSGHLTAGWQFDADARSVKRSHACAARPTIRPAVRDRSDCRTRDRNRGQGTSGEEPVRDSA